jgi:preprotein translocase subunit SecF
VSVLAILFFGGEALRGFSLAMSWGVVMATYSTICVATPMLIYMNLRGIGRRAADTKEVIDQRP